MIDPAAIAQGVLSGLATQKSIEQVNKVVNHITGKADELSKEDIIIALLAKLVSIQEPQEAWNIDIPLQLQPSPYIYKINENWMGKSHFCILVQAVSSISIFTEGAGVITKNEGPGWVQVDLRGEMYSGDAFTHNIIVSYRDDAIGTPF